MEGLAARLRAAADALDAGSDIEAGWLRGAAALLERGAAARTSARTSAVWLEELGPEARARKAALLSAWVAAAEALRAAVHLHESERGPLVEALFPEWRAPSLRRHADQALEAEADLQRRLCSAYVVRRLDERATETALRPALEALEAARAAWAAERDRLALAGPEADQVRSQLLAVAVESARTLDRVRWVVRGALAGRPELVEAVFPGRARAPAPASDPSSGDLVEPTTPSAEADAHPAPGAEAPPARPEAAGSTPASLAPEPTHVPPRVKRPRRARPERSTDAHSVPRPPEAAAAEPEKAAPATRPARSGPPALASRESGGGRRRAARPEKGTPPAQDTPSTAPARRASPRTGSPGGSPPARRS